MRLALLGSLLAVTSSAAAEPTRAELEQMLAEAKKTQEMFLKQATAFKSDKDIGPAVTKHLAATERWRATAKLYLELQEQINDPKTKVTPALEKKFEAQEQLKNKALMEMAAIAKAAQAAHPTKWEQYAIVSGDLREADLRLVVLNLRLAKTKK